MLRLNNVEAGYGAIKAIHDVSIEVQKNQVVAIVGANGVGKSTLLRTIAGLMIPTLGQIFFDNEDVTFVPYYKRVRKGIVLVPEGRELFAQLSTENNLKLGTYHWHRELSRGNLAERLEDIYRLFPVLKERKNQMAGTLSGGEQQMLAIGRGLLSKPRLFLLDEPSLGLSPILVREILLTLKRLLMEQELTVVLVEQNTKVALEIADFCYVMRQGEIVLGLPTSEVKDVAQLQKIYLGTAEVGKNLP